LRFGHEQFQMNAKSLGQTDPGESSAGGYTVFRSQSVTQEWASWLWLLCWIVVLDTVSETAAP